VKDTDSRPQRPDTAAG